uniref:(California timema) hypothetical protein n=1 Tax=Timema californicum TaxID=61474 RepID=A0A7R9J760_TIMCA|nr:unnamed protein product [Timema californicum]
MHQRKQTLFRPKESDYYNDVIFNIIRRSLRPSSARNMAAIEPGRVQSVDETVFEESLLSTEKLDRTSPELWPEQIPGVLEFMSTQSTSNGSPQPWTKSLDNDDMNLLHQFGSLTAAELIAEVKKLHDVAYQLGLEEAKEMTRGKYLNILNRKKR